MGGKKKNECRYMFNRRIGSTVYRVKVYGSENAAETMENKILRLISNETADPYEMMNVSQMSCQSERSVS